VRNSQDFRDGADPVVRRAIDELRRLPQVSDDAVGRVVSAAAAARMLPPADEPAFPARGRSWGRISAAAGLVAAAAIAGFVIRGTMTPSAPARVAAPIAMTPVSLPMERAAEPIVEQFVFKAAHAQRVALVGDFNRWDRSALPMTRSSDGELWSVSVPMMPGRHVYAFMVDDSLLVLDPRAPKTRDPDIGAEGSVRNVGRP
jgi:predicted carbohydrate-binding protein with CBM48